MANRTKQAKEEVSRGVKRRASSGSGAQEGGPLEKKRSSKGKAYVRDDSTQEAVTSTAAKMSQEGRAAALAAADKEQEGYPKDLKSLRPQVEARVKHVVYELGREVDETFQAVADEGLHEAYRKYAEKFNRPWAAKASKKEFKSHEAIFGKSLLRVIKLDEVFNDKGDFDVNGYFDIQEPPCSGHVTRKRKTQSAQG